MNDIFIHPKALVESSAVGDGSRIWAYAHVMDGAHIGRNCNIGDHCFIESGAFVGDNTTIKNGNMIWEGVRLEDGVFVGPHAFFSNDLRPRSPRLREANGRYQDKKNWLVPSVVKRGASLGAGAIIIAGVTVGEYAMVGAGAVVTRNVPAYALVKGNPARIGGWVCMCGLSLRFNEGFATCSGCGRTFQEERGAIRYTGNAR
jgi:acetyltransferase-like isoleucine patch superfamily enzyme